MNARRCIVSFVNSYASKMVASPENRQKFIASMKYYAGPSAGAFTVLHVSTVTVVAHAPRKVSIGNY